MAINIKMTIKKMGRTIYKIEVLNDDLKLLNDIFPDGLSMSNDEFCNFMEESINSVVLAEEKGNGYIKLIDFSLDENSLNATMELVGKKEVALARYPKVKQHQFLVVFTRIGDCLYFASHFILNESNKLIKYRGKYCIYFKEGLESKLYNFVCECNGKLFRNSNRIDYIIENCDVILDGKSIHNLHEIC